MRSRAGARGVAAGIRSHGPHGVGRRSDPDGGAYLAAIHAKLETGEWPTCCAGHRRVIDLAEGDPAKGNFILGSPLAAAWHTVAWPGPSGPPRVATRTCDNAWPWPAHRPVNVRSRCELRYIPRRFPSACSSRTMVRCARSPMRCTIAERSGDDLALVLARMALGHALVNRRSADRVTRREAADRGQRM